MSAWMLVPVIVLAVALVLVRQGQRAVAGNDVSPALLRQVRRRQVTNLLMLVVAFTMAVGLALSPQVYPVAFVACWLLVGVGVAGLLALAGWDAWASLRAAQQRHEELRAAGRETLRRAVPLGRRPPPGTAD